ncbi:hypothetical protein D3C84_562130 [compost metagenome]
MQDQARAGNTSLALVVEDCPGCAVDRGVQVGVGEDNVGALAAQLKLHAFEITLRGLNDAATGGGGTGKGDLAHIRVLGQALAGAVAVARHHVDHTGGETDFVHQLGDAQGRQRSDFRRFDHHGVAGCQGRAHFPAGEHQREVPRHNLPDHTDGLALYVIEESGLDRNHRAFDLVGDAAEVTEAGGGTRHVERPRIANRVTGVQRFQLRQFFGVFFDLVRQPQQQAPALGAGQCCPGRKRALGCGHRQIDILGFGGGDSGDQGAIAGRQNINRPRLYRRHEAAIDEQLVLHGQDSSRCPRHRESRNGKKCLAQQRRALGGIRNPRDRASAHRSRSAAADWPWRFPRPAASSAWSSNPGDECPPAWHRYRRHAW